MMGKPIDVVLFCPVDDDGKLRLVREEWRASRRVGLFRCVCGKEQWVRMDKPTTRLRKCDCPPKRYYNPTKVCRKCVRELPVSEFFPDKNGNPRPRCKACFTNDNAPSRARYERRHAARIRNRLKSDHAMRRFGITAEEYDRLLGEAGPNCAICGKPETRKGRTRLSLDHCHATGRIRGALCSRCNSVLGLAHDNPAVLENAALYLRRSST